MVLEPILSKRRREARRIKLSLEGRRRAAMAQGIDGATRDDSRSRSSAGSNGGWAPKVHANDPSIEDQGIQCSDFSQELLSTQEKPKTTSAVRFSSSQASPVHTPTFGNPDYSKMYMSCFNLHKVVIWRAQQRRRRPVQD